MKIGGNWSKWFILGTALALGLAILAIAISPAVGAGSCDVSPGETAQDDQESAFLVILNGYRAEHGLGPLALSGGLTRAAAWMARDLATHDYFAHTSSDGRLPYQRAQDCGYPSAGVGENIAGGIPLATAQAVFDAWRNSPGHNANMLGSYSAVGIAREFGGPYGVYWVTDFGTVIDSTLPTPTPTVDIPPVRPYRIVVPHLAKD